MKRFWLTLAVSGLGITCALAGATQRLTVVETLPTNGAAGVSSSVKEIMIRFSAPIKRNSWSFVTAGRGEFPKTTSDPRFTDNRTCVISVALAPGRTYSLGINSATKRGFKNASDETVTAEPFVLTFSTARASKPSQKPSRKTNLSSRDLPKGLPGDWLFRNEEMQVLISLGADGTFHRTIRQGERADVAKGRYSAAAGTIEARPEGDNEVIRLKYQVLGLDELEITDEDGNGIKMIRQNANAGTSSAPKGNSPAPKPSRSAAGRTKTLVLHRKKEPREGAFSVLVPAGWVMEGGIFRVDPTSAGGPGNSVEAKLDLTVKRDIEGSAMVRWMPSIRYCDTSGMPAAPMFPPGSNYQGMIVTPLMSPAKYLLDIAFRQAHPRAQSVQVKEQKPLPKLAALYREAMRAIIPSNTYDAAMVTALYEESGRRYREVVVTAIENFGQLGAGMWGNKETILVRAPADEFDDWAPIMSLVQASIALDPKWLAGEIRGQMERSNTIIRVQQDVQSIERAIADHRQKTNHEIQHDMFLTLTAQEEYVNPFTKEVERGSNEWNYRWENPSGDLIYTNNQNYDPTRDPTLQRQDFKRTPVRPRGR